MEPANILFVIAFIGLPLAFGIWALVSRRELLRNAPPPEAQDQRPRRATRPAPSHEQRDEPVQQTMQAPAAPGRAASPPPESTQETVQVPAAHQEQSPRSPQPAQETVQMPATPPEPPPPPDPSPVAEPPPAEPEPEPGQSWSSGTTDELPIIGLPEAEPPPELERETAAMPAQEPVYQPPPVVRREPTIPGPPVRRPFYAPRYAGRSRGVVKRLTPLERQSFLSQRPVNGR